MAPRKTPRLYMHAKRPRSDRLGAPTSKPSSYGMPEDWLSESRRALLGVSVVYGGIWALYLILSNILDISTMISEQERFIFNYILAPVAIILSVAMHGLARIKSLDSRFVLDLGLIYFVLSSMILSYGDSMPAMTSQINLWGISWVAFWILIFNILVVTTPGKTILAALIAASTGPAAFLLGVALRGNPFPDPPVGFLFMYLPNFIAVTAVFHFSFVMLRWGKDVSQAQEMGSYRLIETLGRGGMGEVWLAKHRLLARESAIKLISMDVLGSASPGAKQKMLKRFEREAKATAALRSPHTIDIYDFGISDSGAFYYVMEYLDGLNLATLIEAHGCLSPQRAVHLLKQICHSLKEAHYSGIIHRDIKPANIYICRLGMDYDVVKVLDFGLVKTPADVGTDTKELTAQGQVFGTAGYMAPEIATADHDKVDHRSDIYALGCVAYRMLSACNVFDGPTPMKIILDHVGKRPTPLNERMKESIPQELTDLVMQCLEKDPADRPQSAGEIARRLGEIKLEGAWTMENAEKWWNENRFNSTPEDGRTATISIEATKNNKLTSIG